MGKGLPKSLLNVTLRKAVSVTLLFRSMQRRRANYQTALRIYITVRELSARLPGLHVKRQRSRYSISLSCSSTILQRYIESRSRTSSIPVTVTGCGIGHEDTSMSVESLVSTFKVALQGC